MTSLKEQLDAFQERWAVEKIDEQRKILSEHKYTVQVEKDKSGEGHSCIINGPNGLPVGYAQAKTVENAFEAALSNLRKVL